MINLVTAFDREAKPFITCYGLKPQKNHSLFKIYSNKDVHLIVSGLGRKKTALATAYLHAFFKQKKGNIWINIGVSGHRDIDIGSIFVGNKISSSLETSSYYPFFAFKTEIEKKEIRTVDHPEKVFKEDTIYEMEAYGFYESALLFSSVEFIHCIKIVSDNLDHPFNFKDKAYAYNLILAKFSLIEGFIQKLLDTKKDLPKLKDGLVQLNDLKKRYKLSETENYRVKFLIKSLLLQNPNTHLKLPSFKSSRELIKYLEKNVYSHD